MKDFHKRFILKAHSIAKKQFGLTFPNPSVGCIIVKNGKIISKGVTAPEGRPHAEELAIINAKNQTNNSTMYVTLEPCFHKSLNGSCTDQIIKSGIKEVFIAKIDTDPRTRGKSIKKLKLNNIKTHVGVTSEKTDELNKFFFESLKNKRPYIKVKMAISKDYKIAYSDYTSKWISNYASRKYAHYIRYNSQAILTTSKTIKKDNPRFTVRNNNRILKFLPVIIIDNLLKTPLQSYLLKTISKRRIIIFTSTKNKKFYQLKKLGCEIYLLNDNKLNELNLKNIMRKIFQLNINNLLVEAGGIFFSKLVSKGLIDEIHIFQASFNIGKSGKSMLIGDNFANLPLKKITKKSFGKDVYQHFLFN